MVFYLNNFSIHQAHKVLSTNVEHVVTRFIVLVNLHASSPEQVRDVVLTEESLCYLKTSASAESSCEIRDSNYCVSEDAMVVTKHLRRDLIDWIDLTWANFCVVNVNTVA